jgi:hypothetical protein
LKRAIFILFSLVVSFVGYSQTNSDSTFIKNEEAKKRVVENLKDQQIIYTFQQEFNFIDYLKQPDLLQVEKLDYYLKLSKSEIEETKAIYRWKQKSLTPPLNHNKIK